MCVFRWGADVQLFFTICTVHDVYNRWLYTVCRTMFHTGAGSCTLSTLITANACLAIILVSVVCICIRLCIHIYIFLICVYVCICWRATNDWKLGLVPANYTASRTSRSLKWFSHMNKYMIHSIVSCISNTMYAFTYLCLWVILCFHLHSDDSRPLSTLIRANA